MADSKIYSTGWVTLNDKLLNEVVSFTINKNPNFNPVFTLGMGFAGGFIGAGVCEMTIENAVPSADLEVNIDPFLKTGTEVEVGCVLAGRQMQAKMYVTGANYSVGVNQPSSLSMSLIGPIAQFE